MSALQIISNCLGFKINNKGGLVSGSKSRVIKVGKGVPVKIKTMIVSGFESKTQAGVIIHIKGSLYLSVLYSGDRNTLSCWVIDSDIIGLSSNIMFGIIDGAKTLRQASDIISLGVVNSWYTDVKEHNGLNDWKRLKLP